MPNTPRCTTIVLIALCWLITACPSKKNSPLQSSANAYKMRTINGDPLVFVKKATMSGNAKLPSSILENPGMGWNMQVTGFIQQKLEQTRIEDEVKDQTPVSKKDSLRAIEESIKESWDFYQTEKGIVLASPQDIYFTFELFEDYKLQLKMMTIHPYEMDVGSLFEVLHVSASSDGNAFSILVHSKEAFDAEAVFSFTFVRIMEDDVGFLEELNEVYEYLFGAGIKINWDNSEKLMISVCGDSPNELKQLVPEMIKQWQTALGDKLELGVEIPSSCPPFSDLTTHTYWYIDDWVEILGEAAVTGQTHTVANFTTGRIIDSDVVILLGEFQEALDINQTNMSVKDPSFFQDNNVQLSLYQTGLHELGHLLGLHHKFDSNYPSIMSYDEDRSSSLTDYDHRAIRALYSEPDLESETEKRK